MSRALDSSGGLGGAGESIIHMLRPRHHMTARCLKCSSSLLLFSRELVIISNLAVAIFDIIPRFISQTIQNMAMVTVKDE